jgi:light-regulated signal transduction histidine kinase (bacteriophytochrome)
MTTIDLSNCDSEPIHTPGSIQPHGWLFVVDRGGIVLAASANTPTLTARSVESLVGNPLRDVLPELAEDAGGWASQSIEVERDGKPFDITTSESAERLLVEVEPALSQAATQVIERQIRHIAGMQRSRGVLDTLKLAAKSVRELGGHDRVMVYRFRPDLSGEVVVDERADDLPSFLGQRYPASDIPAQARRLYTINLTRMIVDVDSKPSPIVPAARQHIDLTPAALRSVSPIHLEYLRNMGVQSSFSVSILIGGQLWGLIAGHHRQPRYLSRGQRAYCELLAQNIALVVDTEARRELAGAMERAGESHTRIVGRAASEEDLVQTLAASADDLRAIIPAAGIAVVLDRRVVTRGDVPQRATVETLASSLDARDIRVFTTAAAQREWPELDFGTTSGVLAAQFNPSASGWIFWFRPEVVHTVTWGGDPRKSETAGPLGARLTPRGSFDAYIETVRGTSEEWTVAEVSLATRLRDALSDISLRKSVEMARLRELVLGTVSHDLRNPLTAIQMAASMMGESGSEKDLTASITASSRRMRRLLDNLMELTRLQGAGIVLKKERVDLREVGTRIADEARLAFDSDIRIETSGDLHAAVDVTRVEQLLANLLSNARHHGDPAAPITLRFDGSAEHVTISVHNLGPEIPAALRSTLFDPFTTSRVGSSVGLGLGLYIVSRVVQAHAGAIDVDSTAAAGTTFRVTLPRGVTPPSDAP